MQRPEWVEGGREQQVGSDRAPGGACCSTPHPPPALRAGLLTISVMAALECCAAEKIMSRASEGDRGEPALPLESVGLVAEVGGPPGVTK